MHTVSTSLESPQADWTRVERPRLQPRAPRPQGARKHWVDPVEEVMTGNPNLSPPLRFVRE